MCLMARCDDCRACMVKCPTAAIDPERFLLHAERCLVFHNERAADYPYPSWLNAAATDTLIGCMLCQQFCPVDRPYRDWFADDVEFSEIETGWLLGGALLEQLPVSTRARLVSLGLDSLIDVLPRNLRAFFPN